MARKKKIDLSQLQEIIIKKNEMDEYDIQEERGCFFRGGEELIVILGKKKYI